MVDGIQVEWSREENKENCVQKLNQNSKLAKVILLSVDSGRRCSFLQLSVLMSHRNLGWKEVWSMARQENHSCDLFFGFFGCTVCLCMNCGFIILSYLLAVCVDVFPLFKGSLGLWKCYYWHAIIML